LNARGEWSTNDWDHKNQIKKIKLEEISYFIILRSYAVVAVGAAAIAAGVIRHKHWRVKKPLAYPTAHAHCRHNGVS
jgi:hypothetical protein